MQSWLLFPTDFYLIKVSSLSKNLCYVFDEYYVVLESKVLIIKSEKFLLRGAAKVKTEVTSHKHDLFLSKTKLYVIYAC